MFTTESEFEKPHEHKREKNEMWEIRLNKEEIKEIIKELEKRKTIGPDSVSGYMLKKCRQEMDVPVFFYIIECSLKTGTVPKEWKKADIMLIYKNWNNEEPLNYKPVSLTSIVCNICEKIIEEQWIIIT